ncbi:hypothetical protein [uncultured Fretibacterium sp.]|uniref:hypothetical protein n=1 Tax=uncultured Fretibacterium sp. TaxID=1678694 RepID=UPI002616DB77|nr:hypothetical protein [uncultured Fretibacterium sp.]
MDENKVWELAQSVERTAVNQKHILKLLDRLQTRVETIEKHDGLQEERMAQMQEAIATLTESVQRVDDASHRLRSIALGFLVLLGLLAVLTGVLGWDILPKFLKTGIATLM